VEGIGLNPTLIVDDDSLVQNRLANLLAGMGAQTIKAVDMAEAHARLAETAFSLVLVDIGLPDGNGIDLIAWLHAQYSEVTSLVISSWSEEETVLTALRAGAVGYLLKERDDDELRVALQSVARGGAPIDPFVARRILAQLPGMATGVNPEVATRHGDAHAKGLSERETEILTLVARGFSNREIADITKLSRFTIEGYTKSIYRKLAVSSRTAAIFEARTLGLLR